MTNHSKQAKPTPRTRPPKAQRNAKKGTGKPAPRIASTPAKRPSGAANMLAFAAKLQNQIGESQEQKARAYFLFRLARVKALADKPYQIEFLIESTKIKRETGMMDPDQADQLIVEYISIYAQGYDGDSKILRLQAAIDAAAKRHGIDLEDEGYLEEHDLPEEMEALYGKLADRHEAIREELFHHYGCSDLLDQQKADPDAFYKRMEAGHRKNHPEGDTGAC